MRTRSSQMASGFRTPRAAALQSEVAERHQFDPPFELSVALRRTKKAILGSFAEGWPEPGTGLGFWDPTRCIEDDVLLRWELEAEHGLSVRSLASSGRVSAGYTNSTRIAVRHERSVTLGSVQ